MKITDKALEPFYIDYDGLRYTLKEKVVTPPYRTVKGVQVKNKNAGKITEEVHGYFSKVSNALKKCIELKVSRGNESMNLWQYFSACKRAAKEYVDIISSIEV